MPREWNARSEALMEKLYPGFDVSSERKKISDRYYHVLDNLPDAEVAGYTDYYYEGAAIFGRKYPDLANTDKFKLHPLTQEYISQPSTSGKNLEQFVSGKVLDAQYGSPDAKSLTERSLDLSKYQTSGDLGFEYGQKFVSPKTGKIAALVSIDDGQAVLRNFKGEEIRLPEAQLDKLLVKAPANLSAPKPGDGLIAGSGTRYTVMGVDDKAVKLRSETGELKTARLADLPQKFSPNLLGFTRTPALTSIVGAGIGATAGNVLFRNFAKSLGLNEEQQQTAGDVGSVIGGVTGGTLGYGRNIDLKVPTAQDFAKAVFARNLDAGAVYLYGGSRVAAKMPEAVQADLTDLVKGDRNPFLVLGDAKGVDELAANFAKQNKIPYQVMPADWSQGQRAGALRDYQAVEAAKQISATGKFGDVGDVKARYFSVDNSLGTQHMANAAIAEGIPTEITHVKSNLDRILSVQDDLDPKRMSVVEKLLQQGIEPKASLVESMIRPVTKAEKRASEKPLQYEVMPTQTATYKELPGDIDPTLIERAKQFRLSDADLAQISRSARPTEKFLTAEQLSRFEAIKTYKAAGMDLLQTAQLSSAGKLPIYEVDDLTGFGRLASRDRTVSRALDFSARTGQSAHYIQADIANLGGLNSRLGETGANKVYREFTQIYTDELAKAGANSPNFSQSHFRQGGDEFSSVVYGLDDSQINDALTRAKSRISDYVIANNLADIEHPKYKGDRTRFGTGVTTAMVELDPNLSVEQNYHRADMQLESNKKLAQALSAVDTPFTPAPNVPTVPKSASPLPYDLATGSVSDDFFAHLDTLPPHESNALLEQLSKSSRTYGDSWKVGLPPEEARRIQAEVVRSRYADTAKPDWSKLVSEDVPIQPGIFSASQQEAWKSARKRGEAPPKFKGVMDTPIGYIPVPQFDTLAAKIQQATGVTEQKARALLAQNRSEEAAISAAKTEPTSPKTAPTTELRSAKQVIAEMQHKYSGGTVGMPDAMLSPRNSSDRLAQSLKSHASHINKVAGDIGLEVLQGADYAAQSLRRGEDVQIAIARAGTASATALGASKIINAALMNAPLPGIVKVGAQFVGAGVAAFGADELISRAIGFDPEKAALYQKREMKVLGEAEDDRNKYSFQYVYNRATEGNQIADTLRPVTDIAGSVIDSFNPVHIAKNLGESLANYVNRDSIQNSSYAQQRGESLDAGRNIKVVRGEDNLMRSRVLALQNLANEAGFEVPRSGHLDAATFSALERMGYSQPQISKYIRGQGKTIGSPQDRERRDRLGKQVRQKIFANERGEAVTSQSLSGALSAERRALGLGAGQSLSQDQVQGVFSRLAGR